MILLRCGGLAACGALVLLAGLGRLMQIADEAIEAAGEVLG